MRSTPRSMRAWPRTTAATGSSSSTTAAWPAASSATCARCSRSRRSSTWAWSRTWCRQAAGPAAAGRPADAARTHAQHHRARRPAARRAHRRSPRRTGHRPGRPGRMKATGVFLNAHLHLHHRARADLAGRQHAAHPLQQPGAAQRAVGRHVGGGAAAAAQGRDDERVRLVVFSGAGEKAFVSGADISQFEDMRAAARPSRATKPWPRGAHEHPRLPQADAGLHPRLLHRRRRERGDQLRHPHRGRATRSSRFRPRASAWATATRR
jgi:hypothetical protein